MVTCAVTTREGGDLGPLALIPMARGFLGFSSHCHLHPPGEGGKLVGCLREQSSFSQGEEKCWGPEPGHWGHHGHKGLPTSGLSGPHVLAAAPISSPLGRPYIPRSWPHAEHQESSLGPAG